MPDRPVILVSACLLGLRSAYDLKVKPVPPALEAALRAGRVHAVPVCPEQQGGLPTPRLPAEIRGADGAAVLSGAAAVVRIDGADVTEPFVRGAEEALALARLVSPALCILKQRSPSCGSMEIHDGTHRGVLRPGRGVAAELLSRHGYRVVDETEAGAALAALLETR